MNLHDGGQGGLGIGAYAKMGVGRRGEERLKPLPPMNKVHVCETWRLLWETADNRDHVHLRGSQITAP